MCPQKKEVCGDKLRMLNVSGGEMLKVPDLKGGEFCYYNVISDCGIPKFASKNNESELELAVLYQNRLSYKAVNESAALKYLYKKLTDKTCDILGAFVAFKGVGEVLNQTDSGLDGAIGLNATFDEEGANTTTAEGGADGDNTFGSEGEASVEGDSIVAD